jgi:hypothetical protein
LAGPALFAQQKTAPPGPAPKKNPLLKLAEPWPDADAMKARKEAAEKLPLFSTTTPLEFTLTAPFSVINKDHNPESAKRYPGVLTVAGTDGKPHEIKVQLSARGHFRRMARNCSWVPIRIEFDKDDKAARAGTPFQGQDKLKLGTGCEDSKDFEQITLKEYLAYPIYETLTPLSFRARLAKGTYVEDKSQKKLTTRTALFLEDDSDVAKRFGGRIVELPRIEFKDLEPEALLRTTLYEYAIGNTDYSIFALHNVKVVQTPDRKLHLVPYDFDLGGIVNAPYAVPDRRLGLRAVVDRLYRGPCRTAEEFETVAAPMRQKKTEMIGLVDGLKELDGSQRSQVKDYIESFFRTIDKPESIQKNFVKGCKAQPYM